MAAAYLERAESILAQIVPCGRTVADNFAIYDDLFQWAEASRWFAFCGIIPAFAFAIFIELFNGGSPIPSGDQRLLFKTIEDVLYGIFKNDRNDHTVKIHECVTLKSECSEVCSALRTDGERWVSMDMILGIVLPRRLANYQKDWTSAFFHPNEVPLANYVAMRFAADIVGIQTTSSLVGQSIESLGFPECYYRYYGAAFRAFTEFASNYLQFEANKA